MSDKVNEMRKKVEEQLGLNGAMNEDELKHEVLLEKIRTMADERTDELAAIIQSLITEEHENGESTSEKD